MKFTSRPLGAVIRASLLAMGLLALAQSANAVCASPAGNTGDIRYASNYGVMAYCSGAGNWTSMAGGVSVTVNTSGGGATPAGSSADVQFNSSGALAADTGNFTYAGGLLKAPNLQTGNISATTITATGLGTFGTALVNGGMTVTGQASITTISSTLMQLLSNTTTACTTALAGAQRYNNVSNTVDYCTGTAWMSMGPSSTQPISFRVDQASAQSIADGTFTKISNLTNKFFDTNNNFASNRFTVTVPGKYLLTAQTAFDFSGAGTFFDTWLVIYKNGSTYATGARLDMASSSGSLYPTMSAIVDAQAGDYFEVYIYQHNANSASQSTIYARTGFAGVLLSPQGSGSGSGGTATPAGSTGDIQFNTANALDADTGLFYWDKTNHRLGIGTNSPTDMVVISATTALSNNLLSLRNGFSTGYAQIAYYGDQRTYSAGVGNSGAAQGLANKFYVYDSTSATTRLVIDTSGKVGIANVTPTTALDVGGEIKVGNSGLACGSNVSGAMRYTSGTMQVCDGSGWTNVGIGVPQGTIAAFAATSCPNGWSEYTAARGRFLRGIDNGAGIDPSGTRAPGNIQTDALKNHSHSLNTAIMVGQQASSGLNAGVASGSGYGKVGEFADTPASPNTGVAGGATETRPVNVAVVFCQYQGYQSQLQTGVASLASLSDVSVAGATSGSVLTYDGSSWIAGTGGGTATPAGSSNDVQFNASGALAADTGNFTYTSATGVLKTPSLLTGGLTATGQASLSTVSSTLIQLTSNTTTACTAGLAGGQRYNDTNAVIEFCNGTSWTTVGPSFGSSLTAFTVYNNATQSIASGGIAAWNVALLNNGGAFSTSTGRFTAPATGLYFFIGTFLSNVDKTNVDFRLYKNGSDTGFRSFNGITASTNTATYSPATLQGVLSLVAGDKVDVRNASGATGSLETTVSRFSGFIINAGSGSGGGTATPAGSTADVQFNTSGALDADTGKFTYSGGLLSVQTISATGISATAVSATGLGTFGSMLVNGGMTATGVSSLTTVSASTISVTTIQLGAGGACTASTAGAQRYNSVSNTIDYCTGTAWMSLGPSATVVPSFSYTGNTTQSMATATNTKITVFGTKIFDTNNNVSSNRFTVTVPGTYIITAGLRYPSMSSGGNYIWIYKNNATVLGGNQVLANSNTNSVNTSIVDQAVAGDFYEVYGEQTSGGTVTIPGTPTFTYFNGSLITMAGGGSGGATTLSALTDVNLSNLADRDYLRYSNSLGKWVNISESTVMSTTTMVTGWPDALVCHVVISGNSRTIVSLLADAPSVSNIYAYYPTWETTAGTFGHTYTSTGAFNTLGSGITSTDCNKSIGQLYASGQAFNFIGSANTTSTSAQGDRITSSTFSIIANPTSYASLSTNGTTWGYFGNASSFLPQLQVNNLNAGNVSGTLVQTGASSVTCGATLYGTMRWNATSDTIQICNSAGWTSLSSSSVPNTTLSQGTANYGAIFSGPNTLVTDSALYIDRTHHSIGISTTAPLDMLDLRPVPWASNQDGGIRIGTPGGQWINRIAIKSDGGGTPRLAFDVMNFSNGATLEALTFAQGGKIGISTTMPSSTLTVNGEVQVSSTGVACTTATNSGAIRYVSGTGVQYCNGANVWTSLGGGGGGSPAGSTGDIQYNSGGAFAADTGNLFWDATNHRLGIGTASPARPLDVSGTARIVGTGSQLNIDNTATGQQSLINFMSVGTTKWQLGKQLSGDQFFVYDVSGSRYLMTADPAGNMSLMPSFGKVGIGTTSPGGTLEVSGSNALRLSGTDTTHSPYIEWFSNGTRQAYMGWGTPGTGFNVSMENNNALSLTASNTTVSGNLTVNGALSAANDLYMTNGTNNVIWYGTTGAAAPGAGSNGQKIQLYGTAGTVGASDYALGVEGSNMWLNSGGGFKFYSASSNKMNLDGAGNLNMVNGEVITQVVSASGGQFRAIGGNYGMMIRNDGATTYFLLTNSGNQYGTWNSLRPLSFSDTTGDVTMGTNATAAAFLYSSDRRLKSDITPMAAGLAKLDALNPVSFRFTADPSKTIHLGLIAQDVQKVYPEAVKTDEKGFLKLDYPALIGPIVDMLKELKVLVMGDHDQLARLEAANDNLVKDIQSLKAENAALKAANDNFSRRLDAVENRTSSAR